MKFRASRVSSIILLCPLALLLAARVAAAFDASLSSEAVRDAYFLATGDAAKRTAFFETYTHRPSAPNAGPDISSIQIQTPFASVVNDIAQHDLNYHAPDAQKDFYGRPGDFRVRVVIDFTQTYPPNDTTAMQLGDFWNNFQVHLMQGGEIPTRSVRGTPILSDQTASGYIGAIIVADYDPAKIQSGPATVVVTGPDGARVESAFDLSRLR
jgi:hypothetical protein